jgi:hypothetical protein
MKIFDISSHAGGQVELPDFGTVTYVTSDNAQRGKALGPIKGVVMHWTAGDHMTVYAAYHWCIADNGTEAAIIRTLKPMEKGQHAWGRNGGLTGVSYAATADSNAADYGPGAPTTAQHQAMHYLVGELCAWHQLDPRGTVTMGNKASNASSIWAVDGTTDFPVIMSHQTLAKADGYSEARWDTGALLAPDRGGAQWVYDQLKAGKLEFQLKGLL